MTRKLDALNIQAALNEVADAIWDSDYEAGQELARQLEDGAPKAVTPHEFIVELLAWAACNVHNRERGFIPETDEYDKR